MIQQLATVVAVEDETVWVETRRNSACGACAMNKGCGAGTFTKAFGFAAPRLRVAAAPGTAVGDWVVLGIDERALMRGSFAAYMVPILFMLGFALLGETVTPAWLAPSTDVMSLGLGAAGLGTGLLWLRRYSRRVAGDGRFQPVILYKDTDVGLPLCAESR